MWIRPPAFQQSSPIPHVTRTSATWTTASQEDGASLNSKKETPQQIKHKETPQNHISLSWAHSFALAHRGLLCI